MFKREKENDISLKTEGNEKKKGAFWTYLNEIKNKEKYDETARNLAEKFIENFNSFTDNEEGENLIEAGPKL